MAIFVYIITIIMSYNLIGPLIGVITAYALKNKSSPWLKDHFTYQIRSFWIGLLYFVVANILSWVSILALGAIAAATQSPLEDNFMTGLYITLTVAWCIWLIIRCIKGLVALKKNRSPKNINSWLW